MFSKKTETQKASKRAGVTRSASHTLGFSHTSQYCMQPSKFLLTLSSAFKSPPFSTIVKDLSQPSHFRYNRAYMHLRCTRRCRDNAAAAFLALPHLARIPCTSPLDAPQSRAAASQGSISISMHAQQRRQKCSQCTQCPWLTNNTSASRRRMSKDMDIAVGGSTSHSAADS